MFTKSGELFDDTFVRATVVVLNVLETVEVDDRLKVGKGGVDPRSEYANEIFKGVLVEFDDRSARVDGRVIGGGSDALD